MAFSVLYAIKLYVLLVFMCSCVLAGTKSSYTGYANPYVLVRLKRSPQRSFTFSGFSPSSGLAAFATSADFLPYFQYPSAYSYPSVESKGEAVAPTSNALITEYKPANYDFKPPSSEYKPPSGEFQPPSSEYGPPSSEYQVPSAEYKPPSLDYKPPNGEPPQTSDYTSITSLDGDQKDQKSPEQNLTPPNEFAPNSSYEVNPTPIVKGSKKKPAYTSPATASDDDDEDEVGRSKSKSSSSASFNAWFPIVLGMYPPSQQSSRNSAAESYKDAASAPYKEQAGVGGGLGTTVIANSVSHGKSSVASSHAIAYGGDAPLQSYRNKG